MLSECKVASRSEIKKLIRQGRICVNGIPAKSPEMKIDETFDTISFDGKFIPYKKYTYIMLNKPKGYVSATEDGKDRTVMELLEEKYRKMGLFLVGRLDKYTTGLLILTNDGQFAHEALAPKSHVVKSYEVTLLNPLDEEDAEQFLKGIYIEGGYLTKPAELIIKNKYEATVKIREGRYHQIKQMFRSRGNKVLELKRVSFGGLSLPDDLKEGETRELSQEDINRIFV